MKSLFLFLLLSLSLNAFAVSTLRIFKPQDLIVNGTSSGKTYALNVDEPAADATAEGSPARVYVPMSNTNVTIAANHDQYFYLSATAGLTALFNSTSAADVIIYPLTATISESNYLYVAAKASVGSYKLVQKYSSTLTTNQDVNFPVSPNAICTQFAPDCTTLAPDQASSTKITYKLYFFLSTSNIAIGDPIDPAADISKGGVFFETLLSNKIYTNLQLKVFATNPRNGDRRAIFDYDTDSSMQDFKKVMVFKHTTNAPAHFNEPIGVYAGSLINQDFPAIQKSEITVTDLPNGPEVTLSVAFFDKYGFVSTLSNHLSFSPMEIQELLKKQSCFLLTAGFGEEHYIINFFRSYRDHVLSNSWLGKKFIKVYYRSAPHYAVIIYQSEILRFGIRSMAYVLYFFFNYWWIILLLFSSCYYLNLRKNKIFLPYNGL